MAFPKTRAELVEQGYTFQSRGECAGRNCKSQLEWWTTPAGKSMPLDPMDEDGSPVTTHFYTCPDGAEFKRRRGRQKQMAYLHTSKGRQS
jgi:hypothetical protein